MTLAPPESSGETGAAGSVGPDGGPDGGSAGDIRPVVRQRVATRKRRRRRAVIVQATLSVLFVALLAGLIVVGYRSTLRLTGGQSTEITDPDAPGYVAEVRPTAVTFVALTGGPAGPEALGTMLLVIRNAPDDVKVVPVSAQTTLWSFEEGPVESAGAVFAAGDADVLWLRLGADLTFGSTARVTAPLAAVDLLAAHVGPITIQNPDDVLQGTSFEDATVKYPAGELTIPPEGVGEFLAFQGFGESATSQTLRAEALWSQLFTMLGEQGAATALAGTDAEGVDDLTEVLEAIGATEVGFDQLPIVPTPLWGQPETTLHPIDAASMPSWVSSHVSLPVSAYPGQRSSVAVLNGTAGDAAPRSILPKIVYAGGEVVLSGNAESDDLATSSVRYLTPDAKAAAEAIAAELGVSASLYEDSTNNVDVEVVVGQDLVP